MQKTAKSDQKLVRSDDGVVPALGSQSVVVLDVRIPRGINHINRGGLSIRTLQEAADDEPAHIQETEFEFKEENKRQAKEKSWY